MGWSWGYNARDEVTSATHGAASYTDAYDACTWDAENRLTVVEEQDIARPAGAPARVRLEFAYDGQSRRVRKVVKRWNPVLVRHGD